MKLIAAVHPPKPSTSNAMITIHAILRTPENKALPAPLESSSVKASTIV